MSETIEALAVTEEETNLLWSLVSELGGRDRIQVPVEDRPRQSITAGHYVHEIVGRREPWSISANPEFEGLFHLVCLPVADGDNRAIVLTMTMDRLNSLKQAINQFNPN